MSPWSTSGCGGCLQRRCEPKPPDPALSASHPIFAICEWNVRMRFGVLLLVVCLFCVCVAFSPLSSRRVRELATPKAWVMYTYQQQTAIVPSCPRDVDCKVQIWLWIYFFSPQIRAFQMQSLVRLDTYVREVGPSTPQRPPALPRGESYPSNCSTQETRGRERRHAWPNPPHFALGGCTCANCSVLIVCCTTSAPKSVFLWLFTGMLDTESWCNRTGIGNR